MAKGITVYEVLASTEGDYGGPAGDGHVVHRFRKRSDADEFAAANTCWGRPATVDVRDDVPRRLAQRWGLA